MKKTYIPFKSRSIGSLHETLCDREEPGYSGVGVIDTELDNGGNSRFAPNFTEHAPLFFFSRQSPSKDSWTRLYIYSLHAPLMVEPTGGVMSFAPYKIG